MKSKIFSKAGILRNNRLSNVTKRKLISMVYLPRRLIITKASILPQKRSLKNTSVKWAFEKLVNEE